MSCSDEDFQPGLTVFKHIDGSKDGMSCGGAEPKKMLTMSLSRALVYKKRVAERLSLVERDIQANNSVMVGQEREVDVAALVIERARLVSHMLNLKIAIQRATDPIRRDILSLGELKSENEFYRRISTAHRSSPNPYASYGDNQPATVTYEAVIRKSDVDDLVKRNNAGVDLTQEKIETHNYTTKITIEDIGILS